MGDEYQQESRSYQKGQAIGKLNLEIDPEALRNVIASGRLLELADTIASEAAAQISAQIVEKVAEAAIGGGLTAGSANAGVSVAYIFDGGDFGTVPPRPKRGIIRYDALSRVALRQLAARDIEG